MKATFVINQLTFELDAQAAIDLFRQVAQIQEIFEAENRCGCCESEDIRYSYREASGFKFYELSCRPCGAQFRFGQRKDTLELFPKRKDEDGNLLPNHGWSQYVPQSNDDTRSRPRQAPSRPAVPASGPKQILDFESWDDAEKSVIFGKGPLRVGGELFHIPAGKREYQLAPQAMQGR